MSKSCRGGIRCGRCARGHNTWSCVSDHILCANCGEGHCAAYTGCVVYFQAMAIRAIVRAKRCSWTCTKKILADEEARIKEENDCGLLSPPEISSPPTPPSSTDAVELGRAKSVEVKRSPKGDSNPPPHISPVTNLGEGDRAGCESKPTACSMHNNKETGEPSLVTPITPTTSVNSKELTVSDFLV